MLGTGKSKPDKNKMLECAECNLYDSTQQPHKNVANYIS